MHHFFPENTTQNSLERYCDIEHKEVEGKQKETCPGVQVGRWILVWSSLFYFDFNWLAIWYFASFIARV